jgi:glycosyltransferase involved in cell wall biosynthesis
MTRLDTTEHPLISIITPSFNQGAFIAEAIDSVLMQDVPGLEYLVVDGGSTDATLDVLRGYGDRLRWISEPDGGQADAINKGVRMTSAPIVGWLNADDRYAPGAIARAVRAFGEVPDAGLVYGRAEFVDRAGRPIAPPVEVEPFDLGRLINRLDFIVQPSAFFCRAAFDAVGGLDTGLRYCLDYDLWIRLALRYPVIHVPEILARVRVYAETKTASGGLERLDEIERMIRRYGRRTLPSLFYGEMVRTCWRAGLRSLSNRDWSAWRCAWGRGGFYFGAYLARKVRYGRG